MLFSVERLWIVIHVENFFLIGYSERIEEKLLVKLAKFMEFTGRVVCNEHFLLQRASIYEFCTFIQHCLSALENS